MNVVPPQTIPPAYKMLLDEIQWAIEDKEPFQFDHVILFSRTYREVENEPEDVVKPRKKQKQQTLNHSFYYPEEEIFVLTRFNF